MVSREDVRSADDFLLVSFSVAEIVNYANNTTDYGFWLQAEFTTYKASCVLLPEAFGFGLGSYTE